MTDFPQTEGELVGRIRPAPDGGDPIFHVIRHDHEVGEAGPNVRPCNHSKFTLDSKWRTVTCRQCHEPVDAFAALLVYAEWYEDLKRTQHVVTSAERSLHRAELKRLKRLRSVTIEQKAEIEKALNSYGVAPEVLDRLAKTIRKSVADAKMIRRGYVKNQHGGWTLAKSSVSA